MGHLPRTRHLAQRWRSCGPHPTGRKRTTARRASPTERADGFSPRVRARTWVRVRIRVAAIGRCERSSGPFSKHLAQARAARPPSATRDEPARLALDGRTPRVRELPPRPASRLQSSVGLFYPSARASLRNGASPRSRNPGSASGAEGRRPRSVADSRPGPGDGSGRQGARDLERRLPTATASSSRALRRGAGAWTGTDTRLETPNRDMTQERAPCSGDGSPPRATADVEPRDSALAALNQLPELEPPEWLDELVLRRARSALQQRPPADRDALAPEAKQRRTKRDSSAEAWHG